MNRQPGISFICHLADAEVYAAHHRSCDGKSYTPFILDPGITCRCTCHSTGWDKA